MLCIATWSILKKITCEVIFGSLFMNLVFSMLFIATWAIFNNSAVKLFLARYFYFWIFFGCYK